jgi:hypothetical protein
MPRLFIEITERTDRLLLSMSLRERRSLRGQAEWLLEQAVERAATDEDRAVLRDGDPDAAS